MTKDRRGGFREARKPAPVPAAGPGEKGKENKTGGGPASKTQPLRRLPDAAYGENKAFFEAQQAAPLPVAQNLQANGGSTRGPRVEVFAPSDRDGEAATAGGAFGEGVGLEALSPQIEDDVDILLNVMRGRNQGNPIVEQLINTRESQRLTDPPV